MEDRDRFYEKRAKNIVWSAAEKYGFEPLFLAFTPEGEADIYLNIIIGLSYKWYDGKELEDFFRQLSGKNQEMYEGLVWLGLEDALYEKEIDKRPVLAELREEYAKGCVKRSNSQLDYSRIDKLRDAHCRRILGLKSSLSAEDERLLTSFSFPKEYKTEQVTELARILLLELFNYVPQEVKKEEGVYFLQKVGAAFHSAFRISSTYVRTGKYKDTGVDGVNGQIEKAGNLLQLRVHENEGLVREYITACFGESILDDRKQAEVQAMLCTDGHRHNHVLFTRGKLSGLEEKGLLNRSEIRAVKTFRQECVRQLAVNKEHYSSHRSLYHNSISRLTQSLMLVLDGEKEGEYISSSYGRVAPGRVWRSIYLDSPEIFTRQDSVVCPSFSIDILIDASSSRKNSQELIAAEAYVLEKSLKACNIPCQIYSYCSLRGYTIIRLFKTYGETCDDDEIFHYVSAGNNRDGLALRAADYLMGNGEQKRLLVMLTDACPMDDSPLSDVAFYKNREYAGELAYHDTQQEIRRLRAKKIDVIGVVTGNESNARGARRLFDRDFVLISDITRFSDAVGRILVKKIRE